MIVSPEYNTHVLNHILNEVGLFWEESSNNVYIPGDQYRTHPIASIREQNPCGHISLYRIDVEEGGNVGSREQETHKEDLIEAIRKTAHLSIDKTQFE